MFYWELCPEYLTTFSFIFTGTAFMILLNFMFFTVVFKSVVIFQFPVNKLTDLLREGIAAAGFTECLTFALVK